FDADERVFLKYNQLARDGKRGATTPVYMGLSNEVENPHLGQMNFVDNQVNPRTGTIRGRAVFDNSKGEYTPGLYARLKLVGSGTYSAMLIKDEAQSTQSPVKTGLQGCRCRYATRLRDSLNEFLQILYHAADLRSGAVAVDPDRRRHLAVPAPDQRIPRSRAADRGRARQLPGRQPESHR
nr:hypothetical protein [Tanacetum cinerariifolium]